MLSRSRTPEVEHVLVPPTRGSRNCPRGFGDDGGQRSQVAGSGCAPARSTTTRPSAHPTESDEPDPSDSEPTTSDSEDVDPTDSEPHPSESDETSPIDSDPVTLETDPVDTAPAPPGADTAPDTFRVAHSDPDPDDTSWDDLCRQWYDECMEDPEAYFGPDPDTAAWLNNGSYICDG